MYFMMSSSRSFSHNFRGASCSYPSSTRINAFTTFACPGSTTFSNFLPARVSSTIRARPPDRARLGLIPTPRSIISAAFAAR